MGIRFKTDIESELVLPKVEEASVPFNPPPFPDLSVAPINHGATLGSSLMVGASGGAQWTEFSLSIDLSSVKAITVNGTNFLKFLDQIITIQKSLLKVLRLFSSDLKSLTRVLKGLIKALVKSIQAFIDSLLSTGIYVAPVYAEFDDTLPGFILPINGGFSEFKTRINALCLDRRDPTAPKFSSNDTVGGIIMCCGAGTNDPKLLDDLFTNMKILSNFFGFKNPMPPPPRNVMAIPGVYKKDGTYKPGIKITWGNPGAGISGFKLYRCPVYEGFKEIVVEDGAEKTISVFKDDNFNGGKPVEFSFAGALIKSNYEYIDFEVEENKAYYYQVFSTAGFDKPHLRKVTSPLGSKRVGATARKCIPMSELKKYLVLDTDGNPRDIDKFSTGGWLNLTVRDLLGAQMEDLMDLLNSFAERITGSLTSAGSALDKYIDFISKKIKRYIEILTRISNIAQRLMQYRLQGTVLKLTLDPQKGGIEGFVSRMQQATVDPQIIINLVGMTDAERASGNLATPKTDIEAASNVDSLEGIFVGVALVYGFPNFDDQTIQSYVPERDIEMAKKQYEQTKKALDTYQKILGLK
jgi:hypothetical protein